MLESLFSIDAGLQASNFIKKRTPKQVISCEYYEIFKNIYFEEHQWMTAFALFKIH